MCVVSQPSEERNAKNDRNVSNDKYVQSNDKYVELNETDSHEDEHTYAANIIGMCDKD